MSPAFWETQQWRSAADVRAEVGLSLSEAKRRMNRLHAVGVMERRWTGSGVPLWRLSPPYRARLAKGAGR